MNKTMSCLSRKVAFKTSYAEYKGFEIFGFSDGSYDMLSDTAVIGGSFTTLEACKAAIDDYTWGEVEDAKC